MGLVSTSWNTQLPPAVAQQAGFLKEEGLEVVQKGKSLRTVPPTIIQVVIKS